VRAGSVRVSHCQRVETGRETLLARRLSHSRNYLSAAKALCLRGFFGQKEKPGSQSAEKHCASAWRNSIGLDDFTTQ
jgi:hypothetical protein